MVGQLFFAMISNELPGFFKVLSLKSLENNVAIFPQEKVGVFKSTRPFFLKQSIKNLPIGIFYLNVSQASRAIMTHHMVSDLLCKHVMI